MKSPKTVIGPVSSAAYVANMPTVEEIARKITIIHSAEDVAKKNPLFNRRENKRRLKMSSTGHYETFKNKLGNKVRVYSNLRTLEFVEMTDDEEAEVLCIELNYQDIYEILRKHLRITGGNTDLISSAPDLLEALKELITEQNGPPLIRHKESWENAMRMAQEAINKAEGKPTTEDGKE